MMRLKRSFDRRLAHAAPQKAATTAPAIIASTTGANADSSTVSTQLI